MALLRDTFVHGVLNSYKYMISRYGYTVAKFELGRPEDTIEFGDKRVNSKYTGNYVYIEPKESADIHTESNGIYRSIYVTNAAVGMEISAGYAGTYSSINMTEDGEFNIYSNSNANSGKNGIQLNGHVIISDENYGTEEPADKISSPRKGCIYFKIIS